MRVHVLLPIEMAIVLKSTPRFRFRNYSIYIVDQVVRLRPLVGTWPVLAVLRKPPCVALRVSRVRAVRAASRRVARHVGAAKNGGFVMRLFLGYNPARIRPPLSSFVSLMM